MTTRKSEVQETDPIMQTWKCQRSQNQGKAKKLEQYYFAEA